MFDFFRMRELIRVVPSLEFDIEKAENRAYGGTAQLSDMPKSHFAGDRLANDAISILQIREAYREIIDELKEMKQELNPLIDKLDDPEERAVMRLRYICGHSPECIARNELVPMSRITVYRYLRKAESKINSLKR